MALYERILDADGVRKALRAREHYELDFKREIGPNSLGEMAKDIAGFANHYGGVVLVGVDERAVGGA